MTRRFRCLPGSQVGGGPDFVYTPPTLPTPPVPPVIDHGEQPPSLGRPIDDTDTYTGQVGSLFPGQPLALNYEPGMSPEGDYIHVLETGDVVTVKAQQGGSLPPGLRPDTSYYVEVLGETSITLYRDRARTQVVSIGSADLACACVPVYYTWMDQWPGEQNFSLMQVPEVLLGAVEYIPVLPLGIAVGLAAQIFLYPIWGLGSSAVGQNLGMRSPAGAPRTHSYTSSDTTVSVGDFARGSGGLIFADAQRQLGARVGMLVTTRGEEAPDPTQASSWLTHDLWNTGSPSGDIGLLEQWLQVEPQPPVPPLPPPDPDGSTWVTADLWNTSVLSDEQGPYGMAHAYLGVERMPPEVTPPPPPPPPDVPLATLGIAWVDADLWNTSIIDDDLGGWGVLHGSLGVEAVNSSPEAVRELFTRIRHYSRGFDSAFHSSTSFLVGLDSLPVPSADLSISEQMEAPVPPLSVLGTSLSHPAVGFSCRDQARLLGWSCGLRGEGADPSDIDVGDLFDSADLWGTPEQVTATLYS